MPITAELENVKKFESVGFTHEQAEILAEVHKSTAESHVKSLKDYLDRKFESVDAGIDSSEQRLKTEIAKSNTDLLIKIFGIVAGSLSIAVAILKLFP